MYVHDWEIIIMKTKKMNSKKKKGKKFLHSNLINVNLNSIVLDFFGTFDKNFNDHYFRGKNPFHKKLRFRHVTCFCIL